MPKRRSWGWRAPIEVHAGARQACILKQGEEGTPVAEMICRKAGISRATYFNWKKRYGALLPGEMRRLKALKDVPARACAAAP